jgi:uncharacterized protein with HEPN domain
MRRDLCAYLQDVLDADQSVSAFLSGLSYAEFESSDLILSGVMHKLEVMGEALKQAAQTFPGSLDSSPDARIAIQLRDRIAHGYFSINPLVLWKTVRDGLPRLVALIETLKTAHCT